MKTASPLRRKLWRDLWRTRAQGFTVVLLLAIGVGLMVASLGVRHSLIDARDAYYADNRLADLQVALVRAPRPLAARVAALPGVQALSARVVAGAIIELGVAEPPVSARVVSLAPDGEEAVNQPWLVAGRWPVAARSDEVLVNEAFATARGLRPGSRLPLLLRGQRAEVIVVGIANSPEFVFVSPPGELFPQPDRFAVLWMPQRALEQAAQMAGAFNDLVLRLAPGQAVAPVAEALDGLLARYGAQRAQGRDRIPSARFLDQEVQQLATMAKILPPIFLAVAAFLLAIILGRLIDAERSNIGLMKAFGYHAGEVGWRYAGFPLVLVLMGLAGGLVLGTGIGRWMADLYLEIYRLPALPFRHDAAAIALSIATAFVAAAIGTAAPLRRVILLPPAQALAPPPPPRYRAAAGGLERLYRQLEVPARIVLRRLTGAPRRSLTTVAGLACAVMLLVVSSRFPLAIDRLLSLTFSESKRQDVALTLIEPQGRADVLALSRLPGVSEVEAFRYASVEFSAHGRRVEEVLNGLPADGRLERLVDVDGRAQALRDDGLVVTAGLARALAVVPGDRVAVRFTEGLRRTVDLPVVAVVTVASGMGAYLDLAALQRLAGEPGRVSGANARLDPAALPAFNAAVNRTPGLAGVSYVGLAEASMRRIFDEGAGTMDALFAAFAIVMAAGIAYATASVTLAEQRRDLATLKVLGFTPVEVSALLVVEVLVLTVVALPLGVWLGQHAANAFLAAMGTDLFTFPDIHDAAADARAALIVVASVLAALLVVRRGIDRIDLVESLKSRE